MNIRIKRCCTQADLAKKIGVSQQCVAKWESGKSFPRCELLPKIAAALGCKVSDLFEEDGEDEKKTD